MAVEETRWGVLYCPKKVFFRTHKRWEKLQRELDAQGVLYDFVQSESTDSVGRLMTMLVHNGYKTIIVVGGDTALNDAVNSLMREEKSIRDEVALGIIPNGIVNDFARFWGFEEKEDEQTVRWLKHRRIRKIDVGCIDYEDKKLGQCVRYFVNCVNIGLTADIMNLRRQAREVLGSKQLAFLWSLIPLLFHRHDYKMHLEIDYEVVERSVMTACVGNAYGYGQTPNAVPYSGLLDVSVVYNLKIKQFIEGLWLLITGRFLNHKSVHPYRTHNMKFDTGKALVSVDGNVIGKPVGEYRIHVEQEVINFLIPD